MRIVRVLVLSVSTTALLMTAYGFGYWQGSPVNIVVQPPADCEWVEEVEPPLF